MSDLLLRSLDAPVNEKLPQLRPGDNVTVHLRIVEGARERIQLVRGTVIRMRKTEIKPISRSAESRPMA